MPGDAHAQVNSEALQQACPVPFDEGRLWKGAGSVELKTQLQRHFQNITKVMDCVGCEKCKLWGKLQMLGALPTWTGFCSAGLLPMLHQEPCTCFLVVLCICSLPC